MTEGQVFGARRNPAMALDRRDDKAPNYFLDYAFDEMKKLVSTFPKSMNERVFLVRTTLDSGLQRVADEGVDSLLKQYGRDYHASQAAMVIADLDGGVRTMVGGRDYTSSQFNRATDALRQPGSSFKPYVYATALEHGMTPKSIVVDGPVCIGNWCPHNYGGGYAGSMQLVDALQALDQHHRGEAVDRDRQGQRQGRPRRHRQERQGDGPHARRCPTRRRCRSAPTRFACSITWWPTPPSPISA